MRSSISSGTFMLSAEKRAAFALAAIAAFEGAWVALNFATDAVGFMRFLGFGSGRSGNLSSWGLGAVVCAVFVAMSLRLPSVRANIFRPSWLKALAILLAIASGILEEAVFRKLLMDWIASNGAGDAAQVAASGIAFGAAHAVWGLMGPSFRAAAGAFVATGLLGFALALVYVAAGRSVAPCIAAHFAINLLVEPGLVLAACRGEMGRVTGKMV